MSVTDTHVVKADASATYETARIVEPCQPVATTACIDDRPPTTRDALAIAADLVAIECKHRPLACEAAKRLVRLHEELAGMRER